LRKQKAIERIDWPQRAVERAEGRRTDRAPDGESRHRYILLAVSTLLAAVAGDLDHYISLHWILGC
jgi:hypothetical protein